MTILSEVVITLYAFSLVLGFRYQIFISLAGTILFALSFIHLQKFEYSNTPFCFSDSVYGLIFYSTTGSHVRIKTCSNCMSSFLYQQNFWFESAAWYWHFFYIFWFFTLNFVYLKFF